MLNLSYLEHIGLISILLVYTYTLYTIDKRLRKHFKPLIVGLKGRIYPLEKLLDCSKPLLRENKPVDPFLVESKCTGRDLGPGFTAKYTRITAILLVVPIIAYILWRTITPIILSLTLLLSINMVLYMVFRNVKVNATTRYTEGKGYQITITVESSYPVNILVVDEPPVGVVTGTTMCKGKGSCTLTYYWVPVVKGTYTWTPSIILVEDPLGILRVDLSAKATIKLVVGEQVVSKSKGVLRGRQEYLQPTIREPVIDRIREYTLGDSLRDIIPRRILSPSGLAVKEYEKMYEKQVRGKNISIIVPGLLAKHDKNYFTKLLFYALTTSDNIGFMLDNENIAITSWERALEIIESGRIEEVIEKSTKKPLKTVNLENSIVYLDPSTNIRVEQGRIIVVAPCDWRIRVLESYKAMWAKYMDELRKNMGVVAIVC